MTQDAQSAATEYSNQESNARGIRLVDGTHAVIAAHVTSKQLAQRAEQAQESAMLLKPAQATTQPARQILSNLILRYAEILLVSAILQKTALATAQLVLLM
jgi:hypothetical protein